MPEGIVVKDVTLNGVNWGDALLQASRYFEGDIALRLYDWEMGEVLTIITVNLPGSPLAEGCFWLKSWGENEGLAIFLGKAGLVEYTGKVLDVSRWAQAIETRPKGELATLIEEEKKSWRKP